MTNSRDRIIKRLRDAPKPAWESDAEMIHDDWNGFNKPGFLLESFLSHLDAVKGKGFVVNGVEDFSHKLKQLIIESGWSNIFSPIQELKISLGKNGIHVLSDEPDSGSNWVAVTGCEYLIALTGSVMVSSKSGPGRKIHVSPDIHIVYAGISQLKPFIKDGINLITEKSDPSWIGLITGPSRTADIEKTLVLGAHGPKQLIVFIDQSL